MKYIRVVIATPTLIIISSKVISIELKDVYTSLPYLGYEFTGQLTYGMMIDLGTSEIPTARA